jgi:hypothetical protein
VSVFPQPAKTPAPTNPRAATHHLPKDLVMRFSSGPAHSCELPPPREGQRRAFAITKNERRRNLFALRDDSADPRDRRHCRLHRDATSSGIV